MKTTIQILTALLGVVLIAYSTLQSTHPIQVWSDFKAFGAKVVESGHADVLKLGGESDHHTFEDLLTSIWALKDDWSMIRYVGILLIFMPILQIASDRKKKNSEPAGGAYVSPAAGDPSAHP